MRLRGAVVSNFALKMLAKRAAERPMEKYTCLHVRRRAGRWEGGPRTSMQAVSRAMRLRTS